METIYTVHQKRIKLKALSDVTNLWVWGDVHRDAVACDVKRWQWFLNKSAKDDPALTYYLGMGDIHDFASATEQKKLTRNEFHETTMDTLDALVEKRNRDFAGEIKQMRGHLLGLLDGNHNWRFTNGKTASEDLAERMDCPTLGWLTHYTLTFDISTNSAINVYIVACHGKAGGKRIGTSINQVEDLKVIFPAADIYIMGHNHDRGAWPIDVLLPVSWQGNVHLKQKRQFLCRSGSFMKGYEPGKSQYTVGRLLRPADLGALKLRIGFHRDKEAGTDIRKVDIEAVI